MNKKRAIGITAVLCTALLIAAGTLAWFTDAKKTENIITMGNVRIDLTEPEWKAPTGVVPGGVYPKDPTVTNTGKNSAHVRIRLTHDEGLSDAQMDDIEQALEIQKDWVKSEDGCYYYQAVLPVGQSTPALFTELSIPETWGNEIVDKTFTVNVQAEAVQSDHFTPHRTESVIDGWGDTHVEPYPGE